MSRLVRCRPGSPLSPPSKVGLATDPTLWAHGGGLPGELGRCRPQTSSNRGGAPPLVKCGHPRITELPLTPTPGTSSSYGSSSMGFANNGWLTELLQRSLEPAVLPGVADRRSEE